MCEKILEILKYKKDKTQQKIATIYDVEVEKVKEKQFFENFNIQQPAQTDTCFKAHIRKTDYNDLCEFWKRTDRTIISVGLRGEILSRITFKSYQITIDYIQMKYVSIIDNDCEEDKMEIKIILENYPTTTKYKTLRELE